MKYMKKLITLLAVLTLALAMAVPAFAGPSQRLQQAAQER